MSFRVDASDDAVDRGVDDVDDEDDANENLESTLESSTAKLRKSKIEKRREEDLKRREKAAAISLAKKAERDEKLQASARRKERQEAAVKKRAEKDAELRGKILKRVARKNDVDTGRRKEVRSGEERSDELRRRVYGISTTDSRPFVRTEPY